MIEGSANARWRRWRIRYGLSGMLRLPLWFAIWLVGLLSGELYERPPDDARPRRRRVRFISSLSRGPETRPERPNALRSVSSSVCAGAWLGKLVYDESARTVLWQPNHEWRKIGMKEIAVSTVSLVAVQEDTFWFNRRRVVRFVLADDRELWFESSAANPTLLQLARQFDAPDPNRRSTRAAPRRRNARA